MIGFVLMGYYALPILSVLLGIFGIIGLIKKRLPISSKSELSGITVNILSYFFIIVAIIELIVFYFFPLYNIQGPMTFPVTLLSVIIITIFFVIFFRKPISK